MVKSFVRSDFEVLKFKKANDEFTDSAVRALNVAILNMPVMMLVMNGASLAIIWLGGQMIFAGTLGTGELIGFISYVFQILMSVMMISMVFLMGARAEASAKRVVEVLDTQVDIADKPELALPALPATANVHDPHIRHGKVEFRNVSFKYSLTGSGENVLSNISFTAQPGEVVAIVGGTGTGKSTLVSLIPRLYDVMEGEVRIDDVDVRDYKLNTCARKLGWCCKRTRCSPVPFARTCCGATKTLPRQKSKRPAKMRKPTILSSLSPKGTIPSWARAA